MASTNPIIETGFAQEPFDKRYLNYALAVASSLVRGAEIKWHPGRTGMSLQDFVYDIAISGIELALADYNKGLLRNEKDTSFKNFFWTRIFKAFHSKLDELGEDSNRAVFDERLGKYYEGTAVDFGPTDENDDPIIGEMPDFKTEVTDKAPARKREFKEPNEDVIRYYYSSEKAAILEENHAIKMRYVKMIRTIVSMMSPTDQRLFYLKFQLDFTDQDYQMWNRIADQKHVRDPFTKMAHEKFGLSENYAKKRISQILKELRAQLAKVGHTSSTYREITSHPAMLEMIVVSKPKPQPNPKPAPSKKDIDDIDIDSLSEADCLDILMELCF